MAVAGIGVVDGAVDVAIAVGDPVGKGNIGLIQVDEFFILAPSRRESEMDVVPVAIHRAPVGAMVRVRLGLLIELQMTGGLSPLLIGTIAICHLSFLANLGEVLLAVQLAWIAG